MENKIALESLGMDLKRIALGYNRGSIIMAKRFSEEALIRSKEINVTKLKPYMKVILKNLNSMLHNNDRQKIAEDALMTSTLIQNYTQSYI